LFLRYVAPKDFARDSHGTVCDGFLRVVGFSYRRSGLTCRAFAIVLPPAAPKRERDKAVAREPASKNA